MNKLAEFVKAVQYRFEDEVDVETEKVAAILSLALESVEAGSEIEDLKLVRLAALGFAFYSELISILRGDFEPNIRDEAMVEAVLAYITRETSS